MNRSLIKQLAVAAALAALACGASAAPTSEWRYIGDFQSAASTAGLATGGFQGAAGLGTHFDASAWDGATVSPATDSASALTLGAQTAAAASDAPSDQRRRALAGSTATSNMSPVVGSPAALELTLWNFINSIRAQQVGNPFVQLQTTAANIDYTINAVPAPVPLPAAFWLFAAGLAALPILRLLVRPRSSGDAATALAAS